MKKPLIMPYNGKYPKISEKVFIAPSASIIGDVEIGEGCGVWFNCVIRADVEPIRIGKNTNIQDGAVIHVTRGGGVTNIGDGVTVGHNALLHACVLEDHSFVGMGAIVMDGSVVKSGGMVAAGSLVTNNKTIEFGDIWAGNPAKFFRKLSVEEAKFIYQSEENYRMHAEEYLEILKEG